MLQLLRNSDWSSEGRNRYNVSSCGTSRKGFNWNCLSLHRYCSIQVFCRHCYCKCWKSEWLFSHYWGVGDLWVKHKQKTLRSAPALHPNHEDNFSRQTQSVNISLPSLLLNDNTAQHNQTQQPKGKKCLSTFSGSMPTLGSLLGEVYSCFGEQCPSSEDSSLNSWSVPTLPNYPPPKGPSSSLVPSAISIVSLSEAEKQQKTVSIQGSCSGQNLVRIVSVDWWIQRLSTCWAWQVQALRVDISTGSVYGSHPTHDPWAASR